MRCYPLDVLGRRRPVFIPHEGLGPCFQIPGLSMPVPLGMINAAGRAPEDTDNAAELYRLAY